MPPMTDGSKKSMSNRVNVLKGPVKLKQMVKIGHFNL